jgi:glycosyltransferase involved in cell wall biosynthesis
MLGKSEDEVMKNWHYDTDYPVVSVVCVTYNHEQYIGQAIDSFLIQETDFPFEVVIGDDCSTDKAREIIELYVKKYPNIIKLIANEKNLGAQLNAKKTFNACNGAYLAICDGDDYWVSVNKLQAQINKMKKNPDCNISFHSAIGRYEESNRKDKLIAMHDNKDKIFSIEDVIVGLGSFIPTSSIVIKSEIIDTLKEDFFRIESGDYYIQVLASQNGALFIYDLQSVYRMGVLNSWSLMRTSINSILSRKKKSLELFDIFDRVLKYKYGDILDKAKNVYIASIIKDHRLGFKHKYKLYINLKINLFYKIILLPYLFSGLIRVLKYLYIETQSTK